MHMQRRKTILRLMVRHNLWVLFAAITLLLIATQSRAAILLLLMDGCPAVLLVATIGLAGTWAVPLLGMGALPLRWRLLIGVGVGLG